jgi:hypothetical protein
MPSSYPGGAGDPVRRSSAEAYIPRPGPRSRRGDRHRGRGQIAILRGPQSHITYEGAAVTRYILRQEERRGRRRLVDILDCPVAHGARQAGEMASRQSGHQARIHRGTTIQTTNWTTTISGMQGKPGRSLSTRETSPRRTRDKPNATHHEQRESKGYSTANN